MRTRLFILLLAGILPGILYSQPVQPLPAKFLNHNARYNQLSFYSSWNNSIMVISKNMYWYTDMSGKFTSGPFLFPKVAGDTWLPRLSPSGKNIFMYCPANQVVDDKNDVGTDRASVYNVDSAKMLGSFDLALFGEIDKVRFIDDQFLLFDESSLFGNKMRYWNLKTNRAEGFIRDSVKGLYDLSSYKSLVVFVARKRDSFMLASVDTNSKKALQLAVNGGGEVKASFSEGYPYVFVQNNATGKTEIYKWTDSAFVHLRSLPRHSEILGAYGNETECYFLTADSVGKTVTVNFRNTGTEKIIQLTNVSDGAIPLYKFQEGKQFFTASHPLNGNIRGYDLQAKQIWTITPSHWQNSEAAFTQDTNMLQSQLFSVQMKQGTSNAIQSFYNEKENELIQVMDGKIVFTDVESGGEKKWIYFSYDGAIGDMQLSPDKTKLLYSVMRAEDDNKRLFHYPQAWEIFDLEKGEVIFSMQLQNTYTGIRFISDSLLLIPEGSDYETDAAVFTLLNTYDHSSSDFMAPARFNTLQDVAIVDGETFFVLSSEHSVIVQKKNGKIIHTSAFKKTKPGAFLSKGKPYLFILPDAIGEKSTAYKFEKDSLRLIRQTAGWNKKAAFGTDSSLHILYDVVLRRNKSEVTHNRLMEVLSGKITLVDSMNFYPSGNTSIYPKLGMIVTEESNVVFHDLKTGYVFNNLQQETRTISSIAYSPDGRYLAAANPQGKVMLWDLGTGKETRVLKVGTGGYITRLAFSGDGIYLAASSGDIWEVATGENIMSVTDPGIWDVNTIDYSLDGKTIISGGACVITWNALTGEKIRFNIYPDSSAFDRTNLCFRPNGCIREDYELMIHSSAFHPNSKLFAVGAAIGEIAVFRTDTSGLVTSAALKNRGQKNFTIKDLEYTKDGKWLMAVQDGYLYKLNDSLDIADSVRLKVDEEIVGIDMSYDGKTFACITRINDQQIVQIRNIADLEVIQQFVVPGAGFNKITFSPDKIHLATASDNGFCTIWNIASGKPVVYLNNIGDYGNVMITPDNYYMASKSALEGVTFKRENSFYSFDQFDLYLNRPDIVLQRLGYAKPELIDIYRQAHQKRLKKASKDVSDTTLVFEVPGLVLQNRASLSPVVQDAVQKLQFRITDSTGVNGTLKVFVNSNEVISQTFSQSISESEFSAGLSLGAGMNIIEAVYINSKGSESRQQKISMNYVPVKPPVSRVFYIGIGVSKYKDSTMNLQYAAKDIKDMSAAIKKRYPNAQIDTLLNSSVTLENIRALKKKLMATSINDKVIVSFSGHGLIDDSLNWYFATADVDFRNPSVRGLIYADIEDLLSGIPARQKLLLLDACHSGEIDKEGERTSVDRNTQVEAGVTEKNTRSSRKDRGEIGLQTSFELMQDLFANLSRGNGTSVVSAAGGKEYAFESAEWKNGVFTYSLLQVLKNTEADENGDGSLSVREVKKAVNESVKKLTGNRQKPTARVEAWDNWVLW